MSPAYKYFANDDSIDDSLDQETSQSLLPLSQNMDLASSMLIQKILKNENRSVGTVYFRTSSSELLSQSFTKFYTSLDVDDFKRYTVTIGRLDFAVLLIVFVVLL